MSFRLCPLISHALSKVDPKSNAAMDEGEARIQRLRPVLRACCRQVPAFCSATDDASFAAALGPNVRPTLQMDLDHMMRQRLCVQESLLSSDTSTHDANARPIVARVEHTLTQLTIEELDAMSASDKPDERMQRCECVPIKGRATAVLPHRADGPKAHDRGGDRGGGDRGGGGDHDDGPVVVVTWPRAAFRGGQRRARMWFERRDATSVQVHISNCTAIEHAILVTDVPAVLLDRLFEEIATCCQPTPCRSASS